MKNRKSEMKVKNLYNRYFDHFRARLECLWADKQCTCPLLPLPRHAVNRVGDPNTLKRSGAAPRTESCSAPAVVTLISITGAAVCLVGCAASRPLDWQLQRDAPRVGTRRLQVRDPDGKNTSKQANAYLSGYCMICM